MARLSITYAPRSRAHTPWPRARRRPWARPDDLASVASMFATIPSLPRAELTRLTERMIDRMDEIDGDFDLEPEEDHCRAGDDGCGEFHDGYGNIVWGSSEEHAGTVKPVYGEDQSTGPTNAIEAAQQARARELGLVRGPTGGWRYPT